MRRVEIFMAHAFLRVNEKELKSKGLFGRFYVQFAGDVTVKKIKKLKKTFLGEFHHFQKILKNRKIENGKKS